MFERDMGDLLRRALQHFVDHGADAPVVVANLLFRRPVRGLILWNLSYRRIDAELEKLIELRMEAWDVERLAANQVPIERFEMSQVENESMPFRDRTRVKCARLKERE